MCASTLRARELLPHTSTDAHSREGDRAEDGGACTLKPSFLAIARAQSWCSIISGSMYEVLVQDSMQAIARKPYEQREHPAKIAKIAINNISQ